ncbi:MULTISPECIES: putative bifunctional diguanylate cyclase/phosphodiesterase [Sphingomonas]|uniref:putative bifunctional diguanylate cyclase/phosphodiesterase n=1 Tax=Sphingomonas TaxID=13687 RepID=UPI000DEF8F0F|nr:MULTISPECIES: EAL domain-containing protein [Sphingomonas]
MERRGERGGSNDPPSAAEKGRYERMLGNSATAAICADPDHGIIGWNSAAEQMFGYPAAEAIGQPLSIIIPERLRAAHDAGMIRAIAARKTPMAGQTIEIMALHRDGHEIPVDLSLSMWFEEGRPMFGALLRDVSDRHAATRRLEHLAHRDTLTTLPNRGALVTRLAETLGQQPCALLMLDLDGFKHVNDSLGHSAGDALLAEVAKRLRAAVDVGDFVARLGGDEFAILLTEHVGPLRIDALSTRIFTALKQPFALAGRSVFVGTSIGVALSPHDATEVDQLLADADLALYSAKSAGGGGRAFFARGMKTRTEQRLRLGNELREAFVGGQFELWYQPQLSIRDGTLLGVEALLRWHHPRHGLLAPGAFIEVLSDSTIAEDVGCWVLEEACAVAARWLGQGFGPVRMGVNLFPVQLRSHGLRELVCATLERHGLPPHLLELEITENTVLRMDQPSTAALRRLKDLGVSIAFDDFGTGFASLSLLQHFPLTRLKIDRSFIARIDERPGDAAIVKALMCMAQTFDLEVIAEGVETAAQEKMLRELGCQEAQGFRYGRPMKAEELVKAYADAASRADDQPGEPRRSAA